MEISRNCNFILLRGSGGNIFGVENGKNIYQFIQSLVSKHDIHALKITVARLALERYELPKKYKKHYCEYKTPSKIGKRHYARAELDECVSFLDLYSLSRNDKVSPPKLLTNSK